MGVFWKAVRVLKGYRRSGVPTVGPGEGGRSSRRAGRGRGALPESQEGQETLL